MTVHHARDVRQALLDKGMEQDENHHEMYRKTIEGVTHLVTRISHGARNIDDGLGGLMANQCCLHLREFWNLIECPLSEDDWEAKVKERCSGATMNITAYRVHDVDMPLVPARRERKWMDALPDKFANRCLPLRIANEAGWWILSNCSFQVTWNGGQHQGCLGVSSLDGRTVPPAGSHFGGGILTFSIPYLFRTPPGYNLLVRGPANMPKAGASALEGVVETDWSPYTFTMNWQITRVDDPVMFKRGEPICQIVPQRRGELESFETELEGIEDNPHLQARYEAWSQGRTDFLKSLLAEDPETKKQGWQKDYFQGQGVSEHQTKLGLNRF